MRRLRVGITNTHLRCAMYPRQKWAICRIGPWACVDSPAPTFYFLQWSESVLGVCIHLNRKSYIWKKLNKHNNNGNLGSSLTWLEITDTQITQRLGSLLRRSPWINRTAYFHLPLEKVDRHLRAGLCWTLWGCGSWGRDALLQQSVPDTLAEGEDYSLLIAGGLVMDEVYCKFPKPASHSPFISIPSPPLFWSSKS